MSNDYYIYTGALRVFNNFISKQINIRFHMIIMRLDMRN